MIESTHDVGTIHDKLPPSLRSSLNLHRIQWADSARWTWTTRRPRLSRPLRPWMVLSRPPPGTPPTIPPRCAARPRITWAGQYTATADQLHRHYSRARGGLNAPVRAQRIPIDLASKYIIWRLWLVFFAVVRHTSVQYNGYSAACPIRKQRHEAEAAH